jgi:hypothetical protein
MIEHLKRLFVGLMVVAVFLSALCALWGALYLAAHYVWAAVIEIVLIVLGLAYKIGDDIFSKPERHRL